MGNRCTIANVSTLGEAGQRKLADACIGVAGLGGVGGIAFELLVRAGVGEIKIADSGFFEESNANRQSLWSRENDGRKKTDVAQEFSRSMGGKSRVLPFGEISAKNAASFASGCLAVIDATDRPHSRLAVWLGCKKSNTRYIFASALGEKGMLTVFNPKKHDFEREFGLKGRRTNPFLACDHSLGPVANLAGCLAAQQAMNIALFKPAVLFPSVISIDAFSKQPFTQHEF
ncbi:MAG: ThiF family adenylyltransferase [Candidatus Anstonellaceae archaeon]